MSTMVGIFDQEIQTLDVGQNEVRYCRPLDAFPTASTIVGPMLYILCLAYDGRRDRNSLLGVSCDLYEHIV
jgi:hypothetical protein